MTVFLFFHGSYALAHLYLFFKIKDVFLPEPAWSLILGLFLLFMTFSPMTAYIFSLRRERTSTRVFTFLGYIWMGFIILFFFPSILIDIYNFATAFICFIIRRSPDSIMISPLYAFFVPLLLSISLNIYGYFGAGKLRTERLTVKTSKLPEGIDKLTIVHISDVHLGIIVRDRMLDKLIRMIKPEAPDIIVSTGDLIDGGTEDLQHFKYKLKKINARLGKYAVIGNHEFYAGIKNSKKFLEDAGFKVLRGCGVTIENLINIAGIDDTEGRMLKDTVFEPEEEILSKLPPGLFTLLLKHKPDVNKDSLGFFDLQLSGHTHNGQIFPIGIAVRLFFYPHSRYKRLPKGSAINVSGGVGTAGPPVRLFSPPEITIIEVVPEG